MWGWVGFGVQLFVSGLAFGQVYPWVPIGANDVRGFDNARVDFQLRLKLLEDAKNSIDIAVYEARPDIDFTMPILSLLRKKANEGVRVRILMAWIPHKFFDSQNRIGHYLTEPKTREPIELVMVGGPIMQDRGWGLLDSIHEKIFLVDRKYAVVSGRGMATDYLYYLDLSFVLKGRMAFQQAEVFRNLWQTVRRERPLFPEVDRRKELRIQEEVVYPRTKETDLSPRENEQLAELLEWFQQPLADGSPAVGEEENAGAEVAPDLGPEGLPGARGRALHFDMMAQLQRKPYIPSRYDSDDRLTELVDPVVEAVIERSKTAKNIRITALSSVLHPRLKAALIAAHQRPGTKVTVLTNTAPPALDYRGFDPIDSWGPVWQLAVPDLGDLLDAGIEVYKFERNRMRPWVYLHRKLAILDDAVFFGSHNLNLPSSITNDELSFEIENPVFARNMRQLFDLDTLMNGRLLTKSAVDEERMSCWAGFKRWIYSPLMWFL